MSTPSSKNKSSSTSSTSGHKAVTSAKPRPARKVGATRTAAATAPTSKSKPESPASKAPSQPLISHQPIQGDQPPPTSDSRASTSDWRRWAGLFILSLSLTMVILDNTVLNVAIPTIVDEFDAQLSDLQWVVSGYALVVASLLISFGRVGDLFGRRRLFMIGAVLFGLGSFLAASSYSVLDLMISISLIEGIGAAMMLPATLALISSTFQGRERALAFATWGAIAGAAGAFGPLVGGWLTTYYDWRWAFLINVIVAPIAIAGAWLFLKESRDERQGQQFDWLGVISVSLGLFGLVFALIEGQRYGWWQAKIWPSLGQWAWPFDLSIIPVIATISVLMLGAFVWIERVKERRQQSPLLDLSLLRFGGFRYGLLTTTILSLGEFGLIFVLPVFLQIARGYSAVDTGLAILPLGLAVIVGAGLAAGLSRQISSKWLITAGMILEAIGIFTLSFIIHPTASASALMPGLVIYGLGIGLATTQLVNVILAEIPVAKSGVASGVNGTIRQVGTALGIAIIGTILTTQVIANVQTGIADSTIVPDEMKQQVTQLVDWQHVSADRSMGDNVELGAEIKRIVSTSISDAAKQATQFAGLMVLLGAGVSLLIPGKTQGQDSSA